MDAWSWILLLVLTTLFCIGLWRTLGWERRLTHRLQTASGDDSGLARGLADLPLVLQTYLNNVLPAGDPMPLVARVELKQHGLIDLGESEPQWKAFKARQLVFTRAPGFAWIARIRPTIWVCDAYAQQEGSLRAAFMGLLPLADQRDGEALAEAELQRFLAELPWYPMLLLTHPALSFKQLGDNSVEVSIRDGELSASLTFVFNDEGLIDRVYAQERARFRAGKFVPTPWEGRWYAYARVAGVLVPQRAEAIWLEGEESAPYWQAELDSLTYTDAQA
ncbi:DUF6920 family protein [Marinobacterium mangrovicola]|uniref:Uncharacterized protein n=1 Tax=Marinobacterium mangrovicola TaxID=1476959 RepID=A0A4R1GIX4_9GAMM|nr:DUF6544 family protein [Marinobacterium mangrovicola]TCK08287.1 hypothetical protein CLV83_0361 [Marinobacterium mangrovicola]